MSRFKQQFTFNERKLKSSELLENNPDRLPIICEKLSSSDTIPTMVKERFLFPFDFTVNNVTSAIRNRIKIRPEQSIFISVNDSLLPGNQTLGEVYKQKKDADGFLYIIYSGENTFGFV